MNNPNKLSFQLPSGQEEVYIGHGVLDYYGKLLEKNNYDKVITIADKNAYKHYKLGINNLLLKSVDKKIIFVSAKPHYKDYKHAAHLLNKLIELKASRKTCLLAIGGGYVSDITGFVASIYMRGIDFIQVPTTYMSAADIVIGKVAVNYNGHKNLVGSFYSPRQVFVDTDFLTTLPPREVVNGLVEIWKHALLVQNNQIIGLISDHLNTKKFDNSDTIIEFSIRSKMSFVEKDYYDTEDSHKALSLGHTLANYLERNTTIRHGEAVFYGIIFSAILAHNSNLINTSRYDSIIELGKKFEKYFGIFPQVKKLVCNNNILTELKFDKINHSGNYSFVLLTDNNFLIKRDLDKGALENAIREFCNLAL